MKKPPREIATILLAIFTQFCDCVLTGYERSPVDITTDRQFGCQWMGGSMAMVACNCGENADEMLIEKNSIPSVDTTAIQIRRCRKVRFARNSVYEMRNLREIQLENIQSLDFEEQSLNWLGYREVDTQNQERFDLTTPSLRIVISNSNISHISSRTFSGRINEVTFGDVIIQEISPFAFSNLRQTEKIVIRNSELRNVGLQSFKKFGTEILRFENVRADVLPSRAFSDVTVHKELLISNCSFTTVRSGAFSIQQPTTFEVSDTKIHQLDGEAFKVTTRGDVLFKNNVFSTVNDGAFSGIRLNREVVTGTRTITFDTNTFSALTRYSLLVRDFNAKFVNLNINETCNCKDIDHQIKESAFYTEIRCLNDLGDYVTVRDYKSRHCSVISSYFTVIVIVCVVILMLGLIAIGLFLYYRFVYRSKKYGSEKHSKKPGNLSLIVPDGRTYRETELHVIVERTDPLLTTDL